MNCPSCQPRDGPIQHVPFTEEDPILRESHETLGLTRCNRCGGPWLHLCVEIHDEFWCYWAALTDEEASLLAAQKEQSTDIENILENARKIVRRGAVLEDHPVHGLGWTQGEFAMLEGPPW